MTTTINWAPPLHKARELVETMATKVTRGESVATEAVLANQIFGQIVGPGVVLVGEPMVVDRIVATTQTMISHVSDLPLQPFLVARRHLVGVTAQIAAVDSWLKQVDSYALPTKPWPQFLPKGPVVGVMVHPDKTVTYSVDGIDLPEGTTCSAESDADTAIYHFQTPDGTCFDKVVWL